MGRSQPAVVGPVSLLDEFRKRVRKFLRFSSLKSIYIPPPSVLSRVGSRLYNDGGDVRHDYEMPRKSFNSGFKLQVFNPKPYQTREVWLPDKSTKISNIFWMTVGRQILLSEKCYPDDDPEVTWERIRHRLNNFGYFDISAYGLQYPREYLLVVAEEIRDMYSNPDIYEQVDILRTIFSNVKLQLEDGSFVTHDKLKRGIGLGYYEDLKTIGICALLADLRPISIYGDQGLLPGDAGYTAFERLKQFGFIMKDNKFENRQKTIKWSGYHMSENLLFRPKRWSEALISILDGRTHWERKASLRSFYEENPELKKRVSCYLPFLYEQVFGYEFFRGDSLLNIDDVGCSALHPMMQGTSKIYKVRALKTPRDNISDNLVFTTPINVHWTSADAIEFSLKRKKLYKTTRRSSSEVFEYSNPRIKLNKTVNPKFNIMQKSVSEWQDLRLIASLGLSMGKVTFNLFGDQLYQAMISCSRAPNPFEAYATGGYRVLTPWRAPPVPSAELRDLVSLLQNNLDRIYDYMVSKLDKSTIDLSTVMSSADEQSAKRKREAKNLPLSCAISEAKRPKIQTICLDDITMVDKVFFPNKRVDGPTTAVDYVGDLLDREFEITDDLYRFGEEEVDLSLYDEDYSHLFDEESETVEEEI